MNRDPLTPAGATVLIVDDDLGVRQSLARALRVEGYRTVEARDGREGLAALAGADVMVLDVTMPNMSGFEVCRQVRAGDNDIPILVLTARHSTSDRVEGLDAGADDYLVKPFHIQEFLARLEALIRRATGQFKPSLEAGPIHLDTRRKRVCVSGQGVDLTAYEFNLLQYLMHRPGEVISKSELTDHLYEQDYDKDSNVIEVFIGRLRKKLDPNNALNPIETVRGLGYRFELPIS